MPVITLYETGKQIKTRAGAVLLDVLRENGVFLSTECGGNGQCGKCRVQIISGSQFPLSIVESNLLEQIVIARGFRLACQYILSNDITVSIPVFDVISEKTIIDSSPKPSESVLHEDVGCAVDVGTTTIGMYLIDLKIGSIIAQRAFINPQISDGYDVISRMQKGTDRTVRNELCSRLKNRILQEIESECNENNVAFDRLSKLYLVGNAVMAHFITGEDYTTLARLPFRSSLEGKGHIRLTQQIPELPPNCSAVFIAIIGGFIGSDITAGLIASRLYNKSESWLFVDFGTNGEIVLSDGERISAAATAAGPAFEGAHLTSGCIAVPGAISRITFADGKLIYETIGGQPAQGICGSGALSLLTTLVQNRFITTDGRFASDVPGIRKRNYEELVIAHRPDGTEIIFTQEDIRELQVAKAAAASGISLLLKQHRMHSRDIKTVVITGAFGTRLNRADLIVLGILPEMPLERIQFIDNAAGRGTIQMLRSNDLYHFAETFAPKINVINLGDSPDFQKRFIAHFTLKPYSV